MLEIVNILMSSTFQNDEEIDPSCPLKIRKIQLFIHLIYNQGTHILKPKVSPELPRNSKSMRNFKCTSISFSEKV